MGGRRNNKAIAAKFLAGLADVPNLGGWQPKEKFVRLGLPKGWTQDSPQRPNDLAELPYDETRSTRVKQIMQAKATGDGDLVTLPSQDKELKVERYQAFQGVLGQWDEEQAARISSLSEFRELITARKYANPNPTTGFGSAIHDAAMSGRHDILKLIVERQEVLRTHLERIIRNEPSLQEWLYRGLDRAQNDYMTKRVYAQRVKEHLLTLVGSTVNATDRQGTTALDLVSQEATELFEKQVDAFIQSLQENSDYETVVSTLTASDFAKEREEAREKIRAQNDGISDADLDSTCKEVERDVIKNFILSKFTNTDQPYFSIRETLQAELTKAKTANFDAPAVFAGDEEMQRKTENYRRSIDLLVNHGGKTQHYEHEVEALAAEEQQESSVASGFETSIYSTTVGGAGGDLGVGESDTPAEIHPSLLSAYEKQKADIAAGAEEEEEFATTIFVETGDLGVGDEEVEVEKDKAPSIDELSSAELQEKGTHLFNQGNFGEAYKYLKVLANRNRAEYRALPDDTPEHIRLKARNDFKDSSLAFGSCCASYLNQGAEGLDEKGIVGVALELAESLWDIKSYEAARAVYSDIRKFGGKHLPDELPEPMRHAEKAEKIIAVLPAVAKQEGEDDQRAAKRIRLNWNLFLSLNELRDWHNADTALKALQEDRQAYPEVQVPKLMDRMLTADEQSTKVYRAVSTVCESIRATADHINAARGHLEQKDREDLALDKEGVSRRSELARNQRAFGNLELREAKLDGKTPSERYSHAVKAERSLHHAIDGAAELFREGKISAITRDQSFSLIGYEAYHKDLCAAFEAQKALLPKDLYKDRRRAGQQPIPAELPWDTHFQGDHFSFTNPDLEAERQQFYRKQATYIYDDILPNNADFQGAELSELLKRVNRIGKEAHERYRSFFPREGEYKTVTEEELSEAYGHLKQAQQAYQFALTINKRIIGILEHTNEHDDELKGQLGRSISDDKRKFETTAGNLLMVTEEHSNFWTFRRNRVVMPDKQGQHATLVRRATGSLTTLVTQKVAYISEAQGAGGAERS